MQNKPYINGVINVYKEKGYTSHDVVAKLRGILKIKKIGHTGTLDPDAEGVLPVCIGNATKLCDFIMEKEKEYQADLILGKSTDTQDISGTVLQESDAYKNLSDEEIEQAVNSFVGEYDQLPPMYSALKVNGKKLYELAREGIEVERKTRRVKILDIKILEINLPVVKIVVRCSRGTYIRALCNDIGEKLGTYGCMGYLLRTMSGQFKLESAYKLSEIEELKNTEHIDSVLIPTEEILQYEKVWVLENFDKLLSNGNVLTREMFENAQSVKKDEMIKVYFSNGQFAGVYKTVNGKIFKPEKMFL